MAQTISLDKETFKALAGETRVLILKELGERQKTQSELATKLHLSAPTVNEHLSVLKKAGLVQEIDDGHKWKYFSLSQKGKSILNPGEKQILVVLSILAIAFVGMLAMFFSQLLGTPNYPSKSIDGVAPVLQSGASRTVAETTACGAASQAVPAQGTVFLQNWLFLVVALIITALLLGLAIGYWIRKKQ